MWVLLLFCSVFKDTQEILRMEKIDLEKFQETHADKNKLLYSSQEFTETTNGIINVSSDDSSIYHRYSYESDYIDSSENTFYNNLKYLYSKDDEHYFVAKTHPINHITKNTN